MAAAVDPNADVAPSADVVPSADVAARVAADLKAALLAAPPLLSAAAPTAAIAEVYAACKRKGLRKKITKGVYSVHALAVTDQTSLCRVTEYIYIYACAV